MSRSLNKVQLIGNVGNDPEIRTTQGGKRVANFSLATNRRDDGVDWHRISVWGKGADIVEKWVKKGDKLYIEGRISYSQKDDRYYTNITANEFIMLGGGSGERKQKPQEKPLSEPEDELPF